MECLPNVIETNNLEPLVFTKEKFDIIKKIKNSVQGKYDFCICDCPPNMSTWVICSLLH